MTILLTILTTALLIIWAGVVLMSPMMVAGGIEKSRSAILTAMALLGYPVIIFAGYVLMGWRYFGLAPTYWLIGSLVITTSIFLAYRFPRLLLNLQRGISNTGYFVSESTVYLNGTKLPKAHPGSFEVLKRDSRYAKDQSHIFFSGKIVADADPNTFAPFDTPRKQASEGAVPLYWKDARHVFYAAQKLEGANPSSFSHSGFYGWDASHVYYENRKLSSTNPAQFKLLPGGFATDGLTIFVYGRKSDVLVDQESFEVVEAQTTAFCRDKSHVYILLFKHPDPLVKVEGADPLTFTLLERSYALDKNHAYFYGSTSKKQPAVIKLEGVNPKTFTVGYDRATQSEASDGVHFFMYGELVKK